MLSIAVLMKESGLYVEAATNGLIGTIVGIINVSIETVALVSSEEQDVDHCCLGWKDILGKNKKCRKKKLIYCKQSW